MTDSALAAYTGWVADHPFIMLTLSLAALITLSAGASYVETEQQSQDDLLPDSLPTMQAFDTISKEFGGQSGTSYTILFEATPTTPNSTEVTDVRDPRVLRFIDVVTSDIESFDSVRSASSVTDLFQTVPSSQRGVRETLEALGEPRWSAYLTDDFTASQVQVQSIDLSGDAQMALADRIRLAVRSHDKPPGLQATYTGQPYIDQAFQAQTQSTMSITGLVALLGVIGVVIYLFRSLTYGLTALSTLVFGVSAGFGIFGWLGLNMSPATSGALTMGIGVAIDFGIQPIARYLEERDGLGIKSALQETTTGIVTPMTIGLLAANIGFLSLNVGTVTFLSDLGSLLTLTTTTAYVSAFTITPAILVIYDRYFTDSNGFTLAKVLNTR
jgi:predicted RND superfamily exporter protein